MALQVGSRGIDHLAGNRWNDEQGGEGQEASSLFKARFQGLM